jgi:16S rRNA processing protein RimM
MGNKPSPESTLKDTGPRGKRGAFIQVGVILAAHGIRGQVKIRSFTDIPKSLFKLGELTNEAGSKRFTLKSEGGRDDALIASINGIEDRNAAELLKGTVLYASAAQLPKKKKNEFYHSELVGLKAILKNGEVYGKVISTHNFGAGDILEIELSGKKTEMIPFNSNFFGKVDAKANSIVVIPPEYLSEKEAK